MVVTPLAVWAGTKVPQAPPLAMEQVQSTPPLGGAASFETVATKATDAPVAMDAGLGDWVIVTSSVPGVLSATATGPVDLEGSATEVAVTKIGEPTTVVVEGAVKVVATPLAV